MRRFEFIVLTKGFRVAEEPIVAKTLVSGQKLQGVLPGGGFLSITVLGHYMRV
jgi:hypothetical protein